MITYLARNTLNGKFYIGSTLDFDKRKRTHLTSKINHPFQNALRANPEAFEWEVWSDDSDERVLEQSLLDMWFGKEQCYNLTPSAYIPINTGKTRWWNPETDEETLSFDPPEGEWVSGGKPRGEWFYDPSTKAVERFVPPAPEGWVPGRGPGFSKIASEMQRGSKNHRNGLSYWKNEELQVEVMCQVCPGEGWVEGRLHRTWWVNQSGQTKFSLDQPGPGWQPGRKWKEG